MKKIVVGSQNPVKIAAVQQAFERVWPEETWEVTGVTVSSGVSAQPMSDTEAIRGARTRAAAALAAQPDAAFGVGLEGGLQQTQGFWFDAGWIVILDRENAEGIGSTLRMVSPPAIMKHVVAGMELGHVDDVVFGSANSKQQQGHFGLMTQGALTRTDGYAQGTISALTRWLHPMLWHEPRTMSLTICGSIAFYPHMVRVAEELTQHGVSVKLPPANVTGIDGKDLPVQQYYSLRKVAARDEAWVWSTKQKAMQLHLDKISATDAILVLNYDKNDVAGYVGANTLLEMGVAFYLGKPIFLLNSVPELPYTEEILGMQPVVLDGTIARLPELLQTSTPVAAIS